MQAFWLALQLGLYVQKTDSWDIITYTLATFWRLRLLAGIARAPGKFSWNIYE